MLLWTCCFIKQRPRPFDDVKANFRLNKGKKIITKRIWYVLLTKNTHATGMQLRSYLHPVSHLQTRPIRSDIKRV